MYRGSSFLLQRDYKTHLKAVEIIMPPYEEQDIAQLWDYSPEKLEIEKANELLFNSNSGIYWRLKEAYVDKHCPEEAVPSETLITKILMGTIGCVPAFDRFFKRGIQDYLSKHENSMHGNIVSFKDQSYKLTQSLEIGSNKTVSESFKALAAFAGLNDKQLQIADSDPQYPLMKCVDMYFWETGYELDLADELKKNQNNDSKACRLMRLAEKRGMISGKCSPQEALEQIRAKN